MIYTFTLGQIKYNCSANNEETAKAYFLNYCISNCVVEKHPTETGYDKRPIIEQLNEAFGGNK